MRWLLAIILWGSSCGLSVMAQDLTGQWSGEVTNTETRQKLVLTISSMDSSFAGVLHWYLPSSHYIRHIVISGRYYGRDSILTIREDSVVGGRPEGGFDPLRYDRAANRPPGGFYVLYYKRIGHHDILEGHWRNPGNSVDKHPDMSIHLEKKIPPFIPVVLPSHKKKDSTQQVQQQAFMGRSTIAAAKIPTPQSIDTIRVDLYDNGEIDGDSVSVYLNNQLLAAHIKLTAEAKTLFVPVDKSLPVNKLVLFAENLGKLPPNTALMEVTIHGKTYDLFLSTDYKNNSSVEFHLQE